MAEGFGNFYIDHVPRQQNAHAYALASLAASLTLPARVVEKVLIYSHDLYCPRIAFEDHQKPTEDCQAKEALGTSAGPKPRDWRSHSSIMSYTTYCPMILRKQLSLEGKLFDSITMKSRKHYIIDRMIKALFVAFYTKRHRNHSRKLTMACAELTNPN